MFSITGCKQSADKSTPDNSKNDVTLDPEIISNNIPKGITVHLNSEPKPQAKVSSKPIKPKILENQYNIDGNILLISSASGDSFEYESQPDLEEDLITYEYKGHLDFMEGYLLLVQLFEDSYYSLRRDKDGSELIRFDDHPHFSMDLNRISTVYTNPYEERTDIEIFTKDKDSGYEKKYEFYIEGWMALINPQEIYWSDNNSISFAVVATEEFWNEENSLKKPIKYLNILIER
jgi:hypothetical protein